MCYWCRRGQLLQPDHRSPWCCKRRCHRLARAAIQPLSCKFFSPHLPLQLVLSPPPYDLLKPWPPLERACPSSAPASLLPSIIVRSGADAFLYFSTPRAFLQKSTRNIISVAEISRFTPTSSFLVKKFCNIIHIVKVLLQDYVQLDPICTKRVVCSLQHRWSSIQEAVTKFVGYFKQVVSRNQSGIGVLTHATLTTALYHQVEKKSFIFFHCWMKLNGGPKWQNVLKEIENGMKKMKKNDGSISAQSIGVDEEGEEENVASDLQPTVPKRNRWRVKMRRVKVRQAKHPPLGRAFFMPRRRGRRCSMMCKGRR